MLAFLACVGLILVRSAGLLATNKDHNLSKGAIAGCWGSGISPGHWKTIAQSAAGVLHDIKDNAMYVVFSNLWYRGGGRRASDFMNDVLELVQLKNDFKHDRGPRTPVEYANAVQQINKLLSKCFENLAFFIQYPIRLIEDVDTDWQTNEAILDTRLYMGDHPGGFRQERTHFKKALSKEKLYLEMDNENWALLYPLISIHYCPVCGNRATFFIDRWDGPGNRIVLKSFERGHALDNDENAREVGMDLEIWIERNLN
jgi:hypothetical protein